MIRAFLLLICTCLSQCVFSQLKGMYGYHFDLESEKLVFVGKDSFEYLHWSDYGGNIGKGTYKVSGDSLVLTFTEYIAPIKDSLTVERKENTSDFTLLKFHVIDDGWNGGRITVFYLNDLHHWAQYDTEWMTDTNGRQTVVVSDVSDSIQVNIKEAMAELKCTFGAGYEYDIAARFHPTLTRQYLPGELLVLKFRRKGLKMVLRNERTGEVLKRKHRL